MTYCNFDHKFYLLTQGFQLRARISKEALPLKMNRVNWLEGPFFRL